ncbi:acetate kinase [Xylariaceae sp. FL0804]|nr:acetate kinase [Xylariaceae sp. FL0804]
MIILSINAGSSSVKISVFSAEPGKQEQKDPKLLAEAQLSGLTAPPARLTYSRHGERVAAGEEVTEGLVDGVAAAFRLLLGRLTADAGLPELNNTNDVGLACHRVVHGGDYARAQPVTAATLHHLEALTDLAPLHNAGALAIVRECVASLPPGAVNVACFDSQFHATMPAHVRAYPIAPETARKNGLRKYGFHGISYAFIARSVAGFLGKPQSDLNIIALHLGSGASACAIKNGKSLDTSMGLTPLAGLPGATRSGSVDPSLVFHYASDVGKLSPASTKHLHISVAEEILNKKSGWKALTGTTDFGAIASSDDDRCRLAFDLFVDRICGYVGAYYVALGGRVDALVFAGGIGEKSAKLRSRVVGQAACLGFELDESLNGREIVDVVQDVGKKGARHGTLVCLTDEQLEMARACAADPEVWK